MPTPKLLDQVRTIIRVKHFSLSTERAYVGWIRRFILFHHKKHPKDMAEPEIRQFISHLAVDAKISAATQTVALSALLFLYRDVLKRDLPYIDHIERNPPFCLGQDELPAPTQLKRSDTSAPVHTGVVRNHSHRSDRERLLDPFELLT